MLQDNQSYHLVKSPRAILNFSTMLLNFLTVLLLFTLTEQSELKIISTPDGTTHPERCALTCAGVSVLNPQHISTGPGWWNSTLYPGRAGTDIGYSDCDFVSTPVATAIGKDPAEVGFINPDRYSFLLYTKTGISAHESVEGTLVCIWI